MVVKGRGNGVLMVLERVALLEKAFIFTGFKRIYEIINIGSSAHFT